MRLTNKNRRLCHYASYNGTTQITDSDGNYTGEIAAGYGDKTELMVNYSAGTGQEYTDEFGASTEYNRVLVFSNGDNPLKVEDLVYIGDKTFKVVRIADSLNETLVAVKELNTTYDND